MSASQYAELGKSFAQSQNWVKADLCFCAAGLEYMKDPARLDPCFRAYPQVELAEILEYMESDAVREEEYGNKTMASEIRRDKRPLLVQLGIEIARMIRRR